MTVMLLAHLIYNSWLKDRSAPLTSKRIQTTVQTPLRSWIQHIKVESMPLGPHIEHPNRTPLHHPEVRLNTYPDEADGSARALGQTTVFQHDAGIPPGTRSPPFFFFQNTTKSIPNHQTKRKMLPNHLPITPKSSQSNPNCQTQAISKSLTTNHSQIMSKSSHSNYYRITTNHLLFNTKSTPNHPKSPQTIPKLIRITRITSKSLPNHLQIIHKSLPNQGLSPG